MRRKQLLTYYKEQIWLTKTNEELIELLEERDEEIEELESCTSHIDDLEDEIATLTSEINDYDESLSCREEVSEKAFYAGYNTIKKPENSIKAWLNFKVENRL